MRSRGFTIVEVLVALPIVLLLLGLIYEFLIPNFRLMSESSIKAELQQLAQLSTNQIAAELNSTAPTGVSLQIPASPAAPMIVATNPIFSVDPTSGRPTYESKLVLFYNEPLNQCLFRKETPQPPPSGLSFNAIGPVQVPGTTLTSLAGSTYPGTKKIAHHVDSFLVQKEATTGGEVYRVELVLKQNLDGTSRVAEANFVRKVFLRNH